MNNFLSFFTTACDFFLCLMVPFLNKITLGFANSVKGNVCIV